jgi:hypothetical protein
MTDVEITVRIGNRNTDDKGGVTWDHVAIKKHLITATDRLDERSAAEAIRQATRLINEMIK